MINDSDDESNGAVGISIDEEDEDFALCRDLCYLRESSIIAMPS